MASSPRIPHRQRRLPMTVEELGGGNPTHNVPPAITLQVGPAMSDTVVPMVRRPTP